MPKQVKKPEAKVETRPEFKVTVEVTGDYHEVSINVMKLTKWEDWYGKPITDYQNVWSVYSSQEDTCCGFTQLTGFEDPYGAMKKAILAQAPDIGKALGEKLSPKIGYIAAYVPNTKQYEIIRSVLKHAGFKPGVTLPSAHARGRYTNTRWDFFGKKYSEEKHEEVIRSNTV